MLKFDYSNSNTGVVAQGACAWVANTNIDGSRVVMSGDVQIALEQPNGRFLAPLDVRNYVGVPYDVASPDMPAKQFYTWLKTQPMYADATDYFPIPVVEPIVEPTPTNIVDSFPIDIDTVEPTA